MKDKDTLILESLYESIGEQPIVVTGGMHGDETAGNVAADRFKNKKGIFVISHINSTDKRREGPIDLNRHFEEDDSVEKEFYGLTVPVIKWQDLVEYKKKIRRPTDLEDVKAILQKNS